MRKQHVCGCMQAVGGGSEWRESYQRQRQRTVKMRTSVRACMYVHRGDSSSNCDHHLAHCTRKHVTYSLSPDPSFHPSHGTSLSVLLARWCYLDNTWNLESLAAARPGTTVDCRQTRRDTSTNAVESNITSPKCPGGIAYCTWSTLQL